MSAAVVAVHPPMELWVVYDHPLDYPQNFVVRRHLVFPNGLTLPDAEPLAVVKSLREARLRIPAGRFNLGRFHDDDPKIREVWI